MFRKPPDEDRVSCPSGYKLSYGRCLFQCPDGTMINDWRKCPRVACTPPMNGCPSGLVCDPVTYSCKGQCGPLVECGDGNCVPWCETIDGCPQDCGFLS